MCRSFVFIFLLSYVAVAPLSAQPDRLRFEHFTIEDGLPHNAVHSIFKDKEGFIWIGTTEGVAKFDAYQFKAYEVSYDFTDSATQAIGDVKNIFQDKEGIIWLSTFGNGLHRYDVRTDRFIRFLFHSVDRDRSVQNRIRGVATDNIGNIWIGTGRHGLRRFDITTLRYADHFVHEPGNSVSLPNDSLKALIYTHGKLWIGHQQGLCVFDPSTGKFTSIHTEYIPDGSSVVSFYKDPEEKLWIGHTTGIACYDLNTKSFLPVSLQSEDVGPLSGVYAMAKDQRGNLWTGLRGQGLLSYNLDDGSFSKHQHETNDIRSLSDNFNRAILIENGNLWVGSENGLNYLDLRKTSFTLYENLPGNSNSISNKIVQCVLEDRNENLWIGLKEGGLEHYTRATGRFKHYDITNEAGPQGNTVYSLFEDSKNRIWAGTYAGVMRYDPDDEIPKPQFIQLGFDVVSLGENADGHIIAVTTHHILKLDPETNFHTTLLKLDGYRIREAMVSHDERIWLARDDGLYVFDTQSVKFEHVALKKMENRSDEAVRAIHEDSNGFIWVGTLHGAFRLNPQTLEQRYFGKVDGLSHEHIRRIMSDKQGNIWVSTHDGLNRYDPDKETFTRYGKSDGLQSNVFEKAGVFGKSGRMYFGGDQGLSEFYPEQITKNEISPPVVLTDFYLFNQRVMPGDTSILKKSIASEDTLILNYSDNIFGFEFSALNYHQPEKNQFAYRLSGFQENWIGTDFKNRRAVFTNIPRGSYQFQVKASNNDGVWSEEYASISIIITPPFWQTAWFRALIALAIIGSIAAIYLWRINQIKAQKRLLEKEVEEQTIEIRNQATELKSSNAKLLELGGFKEKMTGMIVHDLKNPLSVVIGLSEKGSNPGNIEKINQSGKRMLKLVTNMLDVHKFESTELELKKVKVSALELISEVVTQVKFLLNERNLKLRTETVEDLEVEADREILVRVLVNLLTNAIKYSSFHSTIILKVTSVGQDLVRFSVQDFGTGIQVEMMEEIFKPFEQMDPRHSGNIGSTGLGLTFCDLALKAHGSKIQVDSVEFEGSTFWFDLDAVGSALKPKPEPSDELSFMDISTHDLSAVRSALTQLQDFELHNSYEIEELLDELKLKNPGFKASLLNAAYAGDRKSYDQLLAKFEA
ncbi:MAG: two-component regulator propeller domain-containing protein [Cyclobacteriaceae bacterium]